MYRKSRDPAYTFAAYTISLTSEAKVTSLAFGGKITYINDMEDLWTLDNCFAGAEVRNLHTQPNGTARRHDTCTPREWSIHIKG